MTTIIVDGRTQAVYAEEAIKIASTLDPYTDDEVQKVNIEEMEAIDDSNIQNNT
jgi:hypothetical protein